MSLQVFGAMGTVVGNGFDMKLFSDDLLFSYIMVEESISMLADHLLWEIGKNTMKPKQARTQMANCSNAYLK